VAIIRWSPANDLASLHSAMDRLFGDVFGDVFTSGTTTQGTERTEGGEGGRRRHPTYHLPVNISETKDGYRIEAPVPGFRPEDVDVTISDGILTIHAQRKEEETRKEDSYMRREVAMGDYRRQISLPGDVRGDDIKATFDNGVLMVSVPRVQKPEPKRIQIQVTEQAKQLTGAGSQKKG
jgi:HSP20 family protein